LSGYQLASPCGELLTLAGGLQDVTAFIDFGPRIADIPDALMARIMACRPIVSLNRQEAEIAAERLGVEAENLGAEWQQRFGAALIVRHDKDGARGMTVTLGRCSGVSGDGCGYHWRRRQPRGRHACRAGGGMVTGRCRSAGECRGVLGGQPPRRRLRPDSRGITPRTQRRIDRCDSS
jgi:hypothetical protein